MPSSERLTTTPEPDLKTLMAEAISLGMDENAARIATNQDLEDYITKTTAREWKIKTRKDTNAKTRSS